MLTIGFESICIEPQLCVDPRTTTLEEQTFADDLVSDIFLDDHEDVTTCDIAVGEDH
jgi:hypothetical protein